MSPRYRVRINGRDFDVEIGEISGSAVEVSVDGESYEVELGEGFEVATITPSPARRHPDIATPVPGPRDRGQASKFGATPPGNAVTALMPGRVISVEVEQGQSVSAGQPVLVVESMKMEQTISSPRSGVVGAILVSPGDAVSYGQALIEFE